MIVLTAVTMGGRNHRFISEMPADRSLSLKVDKIAGGYVQNKIIQAEVWDEDEFLD